MAQVKEENYPAEAGAIGIRIPVRKAGLVGEKEEAGAVEGIDKDTSIKRRCPECSQTKSVSEFYPDPRHKDGRATYCKDCQLKIQKRRYRTVWIRTWKGGRKLTITGITKRPYPHKCELCHRRVGIEFKWLNYHHWDDKDLRKGKYIKGVWICPTCHFVCGVIDGNSALGEKYRKLKRAINQQFRKRQLSTISER